MCKRIDYKNKETNLKQESRLSPDTIHCYFKNIFQADHLSTKPTVGQMKHELEDYCIAHDQLDQDLTYGELNQAIAQIP